MTNPLDLPNSKITWRTKAINIPFDDNFTLSKIYQCISVLELMGKTINSKYDNTFGFFELSFVKVNLELDGSVHRYTYEDGGPIEEEILKSIFLKRK